MHRRITAQIPRRKGSMPAQPCSFTGISGPRLARKDVPAGGIALYSPYTASRPVRKMQDRTPLPEKRSAAASIAALRSAVSSFKQTFRPCRLGLLALAFAVALWGYGYKMSRFEFRNDSGVRFPIARFLVEHRSGNVGGPTLRLKRQLRTQLDTEKDALVAGLQFSSPVLSYKAARVIAPARALPFFDSALPLRSPPPIAA